MMQKILLVTLLFCLMSINQDGIFTMGIKSEAQTCPANQKRYIREPDGESVFSWFIGVLRSVGNRIGSFLSSATTEEGEGDIANNAGGDAPTNFNIWTTLSSLGQISSTYGQPLVFTGGSNSLINTIEIPETGPPEDADCNGDLGGLAYLDGCGRCVGGNTILYPCYVPPVRSDTTEPTIDVNCDTIAINNSNLLTGLLNSIDTTWQMKNMRNNLKYRMHEVGLAIYPYNNNGTIVNKVTAYDTSGSSQNVTLIYTPHTKAWVHSHIYKTSNNVKIAPGPSPRDIYTLMKVWKTQVDTFGTNNFFASFVLAGDSSSEYALAITDTNKIKAFLLQYPLDSVIDTRDSVLADSVMVPNRKINGWNGDVENVNSFYSLFIEAYKKLSAANYYKEELDHFATVHLMKHFDMGIKLYMKNDGNFKELNPYTDSSTGKISYKIKICL